MQHPFMNGGIVAGDKLNDLAFTFASFRHHGVWSRPIICLSEEVQERERALNCSVFLGQELDDKSGLMAARNIWSAFKNGEIPDDLGENILNIIRDFDEVTSGVYRRILGKRVIPPYKRILLSARSEQVPNPDSRVTLSEKRDELGLNTVRLDWRMTELDRRTIRIMAKTIGEELGRLNMGRVRLAKWLLDDVGNWMSWNVSNGNHHMGTTRMSENPKKGVVDKNCRLHGLRNLYIAGSSVFPTGGYANPTLTIVALALRLAEHLKLQFSNS